MIPFSKDEAEDLFKQFSNQEKIEIEDGLVEEIHEYTLGFNFLINLVFQDIFV
jgi:hypothetical protein